jgi:hypothetical protein
LLFREKSLLFREVTFEKLVFHSTFAAEIEETLIASISIYTSSLLLHLDERRGESPFCFYFKRLVPFSQTFAFGAKENGSPILSYL